MFSFLQVSVHWWASQVDFTVGSIVGPLPKHWGSSSLVLGHRGVLFHSPYPDLSEVVCRNICLLGIRFLLFYASVRLVAIYFSGLMEPALVPGWVFSVLLRK
jgi:hypothetical protein